MDNRGHEWQDQDARVKWNWSFTKRKQSPMRQFEIENTERQGKEEGNKQQDGRGDGLTLGCISRVTKGVQQVAETMMVIGGGSRDGLGERIQLPGQLH